MKPKLVAVKIHIPEPCSQPWEAMTLKAGGRHCAACAQTVLDFTRMTDAQILEVMRSSAGGCGRFRADQVNRNLVTPPANKKFPLKSFYKLAASLLLLFSAGKATAQARKEIRTEETVTETTSQVYSTITGFVIDSTGEPLTGATIKLDEHALSLVAGIDGEFEMRIPDSAFSKGTVNLIFSFVGYRSESVIFSREDFPLALRIKMVRPSESKTDSGNFEIIPPSEITKQVIDAKEIENMARRDVAVQGATRPWILQSRRDNDLIVMGARSFDNTVYIIDGVLQTGTSVTLPKSKKWWQFWNSKRKNSK